MKEEMNEIIKKIKDELLPIGTIICYASPECPKGFLPCDGREVLQSMYPELYEVIRNNYGKPQNAQGFLIPDLRGLFVRGYDEAGNVDPERKFADVQEDTIQGHGHNVQPVESLSSGEHFHFVRNALKVCASGWIACENVYSVIEGGTSKDKTTTSGGHTHSIPETKALEMISSGYQKVRVDIETRPKNIALLYCIKAK